MTKFLTELITDETPILKLSSNSNISEEEKEKVLDLDCSLTNRYIDYMHYHNGSWYYFKKDDNDYAFPFYMADELMGTYLAKYRNLQTISYEIAKVKDSYGLASINFKQPGFKYYTIVKLIYGISASNGISNIDTLKGYTIDDVNEQEFMTSLFNLLALDIHMLQKDRGEVNLQFQVNEETGHFNLAPLYDYSACSQKIGLGGLSVINKIARLDEVAIPSLIRRFPQFRESLEFCLEQSMKEIWEQICLDYHLNQECSAYERIKDYYEVKDESQKQYIKTMLSHIKK